MTDISKILCEKIDKERIKINEPMKEHTSFKIGGNADIFISAKNSDEIKFTIEKCNENGIKYFIMGNGSNLLVRDKGYRGVIIQLYKNFNETKVEGNTIIAQSGILLSTLANYAMKESLAGMEFASGIPGTLGGAIAMNAGAYGGEIRDIVKRIEVLKENKIISLNGDEAEFEYRNSKILKEKMIVLNAEIELKKGRLEEIKSKMAELNKRRNEKQPTNMPSAGSTFKRPEGYFAGKLIMDCGLRGFKVGGAEISEKHCGFVVNTGGASAEDVISLIEKVKEKVYNEFDVTLEMEVRVIGEE